MVTGSLAIMVQVHLYLASNPSGSSEQHSATHAQYARQLHINQLTWVYHDPTQVRLCTRSPAGKHAGPFLWPGEQCVQPNFYPLWKSTRG